MRRFVPASFVTDVPLWWAPRRRLTQGSALWVLGPAVGPACSLELPNVFRLQEPLWTQCI